MKHKIEKTILFLLTISVLCSCVSMGKFDIQVAIPPKCRISPDIQSIAILNRSMTPDFINIPQDSTEKGKLFFQGKLYTDELSLNTSFFDSTASDTAVKVAANAIYDSQRFDVVVPLERNILRNNKGGISDPLDPTTINFLCKDFNVDGILVLESFSEWVNREILTRESNSFQYLFTGIIDLSYKSDWRLYQPSQDPRVLSFVADDTIFWNSAVSSHSIELAFNQLPSIKEALTGGGTASGMDIAHQISPNWVDETRRYFITRKENIDEAIPLVKMNKWDEAAEIWMKYSTVPSISLRSKIEFNLALAAEMTGDLDRAVEWGVKSYKTKYSRNAELYLKDLGRRRSTPEEALKSM
jgi:hypothetical protein